MLLSGPDNPLCLRFWTHMYGNGIGALSILLSDTTEAKEWEVWSLSGEAGNAWYQAELPISSANPFMVGIGVCSKLFSKPEFLILFTLL
jgi:hypothetical protein